MQVGHAGKGFQEDVMVGRIVGDHRRAGDGLDAIGVDLERRVPEIFREMMLACREAQIWRGRIQSEGQRKRELHRRSVRHCPFAGEVEYHEAADASGLERARIVDRVAAVEDQHRETLTRSQEVAIESAE